MNMKGSAVSPISRHDVDEFARAVLREIGPRLILPGIVTTIGVLVYLWFASLPEVKSYDPGPGYYVPPVTTPVNPW